MKRGLLLSVAIACLLAAYDKGGVMAEFREIQLPQPKTKGVVSLEEAIAQNIHLEAVALGLASVPIGAFNDAEVDKILGLAKGCHTFYIIPVGHKS